MNDLTTTPCPICNKLFKDRLRIHLINKHGIRDPDATTIKNLCIGLKWGYEEEKKERTDELKKILANNGFRFEKLRMEV